MDLIALTPADPANAAFHANWTGWGILGDLLEELGQDLSTMAGSNDGFVVTAGTARDWGEAVLANLDRVLVCEFKDDTYSDGTREEFHVDGTEHPVFVSTGEAARIFVDAMFNKPVKEPAHPDEVATPVPLTKDHWAYEWFTEFANFCIQSGGFEQW